MKYTLSQAATATGKNKATIQRAIKSGKISATKNSSGAYDIDPSELHRIFPATAKRVAQQDISNDTQHLDKHDETMQIKLNLLEAEREREREQLQATIDDCAGQAKAVLEQLSSCLVGMLSIHFLHIQYLNEKLIPYSKLYQNLRRLLIQLLEKFQIQKI